MATLFEKIKRALGFYPPAPFYYKTEEKTVEPVKVTYAPAPEPVVEQSFVPEEPISSQEAAVDAKDDGRIDLLLAAMTRADLIAFARDRGLTVTARMKKQEIIDLINSAL